MKSVRLGAVFMVSIMALAGLGIGFAHWEDLVTVDGTIYMGSVTFGFTSLVASWDYEDYAWPITYYGDPNASKHTATEVCTLHDPYTDVHTNKTVYKLLRFNITGAYPAYWAINKFTLDNAGTIPIKIQNVTITVPSGFWVVENVSYPGVLWDVYNASGNIYNIWLYIEPEDYGPGWEIEPPWLFPGAFGSIYGVRPLKGLQIHPCHENLTEICVDTKQPAEECHTYTFTIEIEAIQWNLYT